MGQKGCRTEGKMCMGTLWDRKMAPMHYGTKRLRVRYRTEGKMCMGTLWDRKMAPMHYGTKRMWVHYRTEGKMCMGLWDKKDVGTL